MAIDVAANERGSAPVVKAAALSAFAELGYHGTSVREIARRAHTSVAALYHYYPSKELLLAELIDAHLRDLLIALVQADVDAGTEASERMSAVVRAHVAFHLQNPAEGRVCNAELHRLPPTARTGAVERRKQERAMFETIVAAGVDEGCFVVPHVPAAARAVLEMCTAVLDRYDDERVAVEHLAETYSVLALNVVGYRAAEVV